jgi:hypothetical protein
LKTNASGPIYTFSTSGCVAWILCFQPCSSPIDSLREFSGFARIRNITDANSSITLKITRALIPGSIPIFLSQPIAFSIDRTIVGACNDRTPLCGPPETMYRQVHPDCL